MNLFRTKPKERADKPQDDRAAIERKLAECTAELKEADAELSRLSLAAFQTGDAAAALAVLDKLRALENQRDLLVAALVECQRVEAEREAVFRAQQNVTAKRSLAQHSSSFARDAGDVAKAISDLKDATERLQSSGASIVAVCPAHMRTPSFPIHELLGVQGLKGRIEVEQFRLDRQRPKPRPGFTYEDNASGEIKPLTDTLADLVASIRADFDSAPTPPIAPLKIAIGDGADAPGVAGDRCASPPVAGNPVAAQTHSGAFVNLCSPGIGEPIEQAAEPHSEALGAPAVDYTKLFS
jgi:hypothetical protein